MTTKLRLKRTPTEEQEHTRRKAYKTARKAARWHRAAHDDDYDRSRKKSRPEIPPEVDPDDDVYGPSPPPTSSHKSDYDTVRAELEEIRFREKMWDALADDERLDGINTRFNDYAHIPDRWSRDEHDLANPQYMDDDEYAEWIRKGMWKKKHAREFEEQAKRDAEKAAQRKRDKEIRAETTRLEQLALRQEERRRKERQRQREEEYRQQYEERWKALWHPLPQDLDPLTFGDIPWPLFTFQPAKRKAPNGIPPRIEEITPEAISTFLLPDNDGAKCADILRRNRDKLKDTLLRFHPDKFEGRIMHRVHENDVESVRDTVGQVARILNALLSEQSRPS